MGLSRVRHDLATKNDRKQTGLQCRADDQNQAHLLKQVLTHLLAAFVSRLCVLLEAPASSDDLSETPLSTGTLKFYFIYSEYSPHVQHSIGSHSVPRVP